VPYHDFTEMPVWQKANEIVEELIKIIKGLKE